MEGYGHRRGTVDLQNWSTWRHQQTVDQLQKLKEETFGKSNKECTFAPKIPDRTSKVPINTPTKFMNRLKKKDEERAKGIVVDPPEIENIDDNGDRDQHRYSRNMQSDQFASKVPPPTQEPSQEYSERIKELEEEVRRLQADKDDLLSEKKFWLTRFQTDNTKLALLLKNTKAAKQKLLQEIDNLEKERSRIGSVQADALETSVLDRVLANSSLSEGNRSQLPSHMRGRADEVYKTLSSLATRCRANQAEIFSLVISKVEEAENGFVSKRDDILETSIEELRNIASASPGNVMAATNVAKAFSAPMLAALFDKRDELLRREGMSPATATAPPGETGPSEATELSTADAQGIAVNDDIKTIQAQNNTLRALVAQLRKKNAELRGKLSSIAVAPSNTAGVNKSSRSSTRSSSGYGRSSSRLKSSGSSGGGAASPGADSASEESDPEDSADQSPPPDPSTARERRRTRLSSVNQTTGNFEDLDQHVQDIAHSAILAYSREVVRSNPLADRIPVTVLQETISEIAVHVRTQVALPLLIAAGNKRWKLSMEGGEGEGASGDVDVEGEVEACVKKTLSTPKVYAEIVALSMMALTYTHSRVSAIEDGETELQHAPRRAKTTRAPQQGGTNIDGAHMSSVNHRATAPIRRNR